MGNYSTYFYSGQLKTSAGNSAGRVTERFQMKNAVQTLARGVLKVGDVIQRNGKKLVVTAVTVGGAALACAQTDATVIATNAQTAFGTIAPITITIAGFYVILRIAKKVVS